MIGPEVQRQLEEMLERSRQRVAAMIEQRHANGETDPEAPAPEEPLVRKWNVLCPTLFQHTEIARLPCSRGSIEKVMAHPIRKVSLRLVGPTGTGKTRLAYQLLKGEHYDGASILAFDAWDFGAQASDAYRNGAEVAFFTRLMRPDILFLDDLGKSRMTERVTEAIFTVIDRRANALKPILTTQNYTGDLFREKLVHDEIDHETIEAMLRRMKEHFTTIPVTKG